MGLMKKFYTARKRPPRWVIQTPDGEREYTLTIKETIQADIDNEGAAMVDTQDLYEYLGLSSEGFVNYEDIAAKADAEGVVVEEHGTDSWEISKEASCD